jgi:ABC-type transport system involved in multi-copper enzyme maturation permease subunit
MRHWGLGPVFAYEWLRASRRWQLYALRSLFVAALAAGLTVVWMFKLAGKPPGLRVLADTGEAFFYALVGTQLALVLLIAPAYTAGTICLDKSRGTLLHLLATDLSDAEIVLGKLAAGLLPVIGLVVCGVPVLFGAGLLGGIDPEAALGAVLVTLGVAVLAGTLALALSVWARQTHEVLLATYLIGALLALAGPMWAQWQRAFGLPPPPDWLEATNPFFLAFLPYLRPGTRCLDGQALFLGITLALSAALAVLAVLRLRAVALGQAGRPARLRPGGALAGLRWRDLRLPGPSLDGNPVLWREWHRRLPSRWARLAWLVYGGLALVFSLLAVAQSLTSTGPQPLVPWVNALQVPFGLLLLSVTSVTSLGEERLKGTLDVLLATPLPTRTIVLGKWWGAYRSAVLLAVLPGLVAAAATGGSFLGCWGASLLVGLVLAYGAATTSLGLALSTWVARPGRALALGVLFFVLVTVGPFLPLLLLRWGPGGESLASASPFFGMGELTDVLGRHGGPGGNELEILGWDVVWLLIYLGTAVALLVLTLATFDRCLGRVDTGAPSGWAGPARRRPPTLVGR